jgi:KaiC/GvpD/RAD55 family RecA-like ATPase
MSKPSIDSNDIPPELKQFLQRDTYSLLIRGKYGSGKTALSLTILRSLKATDNFFYISTRTSPTQLFDYYPWLSKFVKKRDSLNQYANSEEHPVHPCFEDARLDEPESLFERITNQLMDIKSPIIIIDSWDAIASLMDKESRINNERVLQTWRERAGARIIFITEGVQDSGLDYIADGVVELSNDISDNTAIRKLTITKLRGVPIEKTTYLFSLKGGVFKCFSKYLPLEYNSLIHNLANRLGAHIVFRGINISMQSGFTDLDRALGGGYQEGSIVIVKADKILSHILPLLFLERTIKEFMYKDGEIVVSGSSILYSLNQIISVPINRTTEKSSGFLHFKFESQKLKRNERNLQNRAACTELTSLLDLQIFKEKKKTLNLMGLDSLQNSMTKEGMNLYDVSRLLKNNFTLSFIIVNSDDDIQRYKSICDIYLKFVVISGTLILKCVLPSLGAFGVKLSDSQLLQLLRSL